MSEFDTEPVPGLPEHLPTGESLLWQGSPSWQGIARRSLHVGVVALYFGALMAWAVVSAVGEGASLLAAAGAAGRIAIVGLVALGILSFVAWLIERTTIYSITSKRIVMRYGVALPVTLNLPYKAIGAADLKLNGDGTGDIALKIGSNDRLGYLNLWPHVRGWRINRPQPVLKSVPDVKRVTELLVSAMKDAARSEGTAVRVATLEDAETREGFRGASGAPAAA